MTIDSRLPARARCSMVLAEPAAGAGQLPMFHTVPPAGRYPSVIDLADGDQVAGTLVIDDQAIDQILARFQEEAARPGFAGLLVDREHLSELPAGDSTAAAWVKTMARRPDGLWTGWELTDLGDQLINNKRFKFRSPVLDLEKIAGTENEWRPVRLVSVALTNVPHFKQLAPSSLNRESGAATGGSGMTLVERLRARLGKPDAKEDEVFDLLDAALKTGETVATEKAKLEARVTELETADLNRQADAFVSEHEAKVSDKAKLRARFIADPAGTRESFAMLKIVEVKPARQLGRDGAGNPGDRTDGQTREAAVDAAQAKYRCATRAAAWELAKRDNPKLFAS